MFSGIVEETGVVQQISRKPNLNSLMIKANKVVGDTRVGDSICVDGVCLTVTRKSGKSLTFDIMKESLDVTTLGLLERGSRVNLEQSLRANGKLGGHFVSGHVDGVETIKNIVTIPNYVEFQVTICKELKKYIVPKGSVTIDGVSLTVGKVRTNDFSVYLIPHTLKVTTFGRKKKGDKVNIETDILAKYVLFGQSASSIYSYQP